MHLIDRRLNPSGKSLANRQRFLRRARAVVRKAVRDLSGERSVREIEEGGAVTISADGLEEPTFHRGRSGTHEHVLPGNREYLEGDKIRRPDGGGRSEGDDEGEGHDGKGEDSFKVVLSTSEFLDLFLEDLELPDLEKRKLSQAQSTSLRRAGYSMAGSPANLAIGRTTRNALLRRIALHRPKPEEIEKLEAAIAEAKRNDDLERVRVLEGEFEWIMRRFKSIPYIDPIDIRYRRFEPENQPIAQAVMFCLMDVSGSMSEHMKDLAKRFFMLLYVFLKQRYRQVDIVFIRHTDEAKEVDEETFFNSRETGGTRVSSALTEMAQIIGDRYPLKDWNIYGAQASDGDNEHADNELAETLLRTAILPLSQYFAYLEVAESDYSPSRSSLWKTYEAMGESHLAMRRVSSRQEIFPVFRELFRRQSAAEKTRA
jgi:uncharacterized protein